MRASTNGRGNTRADQATEPAGSPDATDWDAHARNGSGLAPEASDRHSTPTHIGQKKYPADMTEEHPTFVTQLECSIAGERFEADRFQGLSSAGKPFLVRYDLDALARAHFRRKSQSPTQNQSFDINRFFYAGLFAGHRSGDLESTG